MPAWGRWGFSRERAAKWGLVPGCWAPRSACKARNSACVAKCSRQQKCSRAPPPSAPKCSICATASASWQRTPGRICWSWMATPCATSAACLGRGGRFKLVGGVSRGRVETPATRGQFSAFSLPPWKFLRQLNPVLNGEAAVFVESKIGGIVCYQGYIERQGMCGNEAVEVGFAIGVPDAQGGEDFRCFCIERGYVQKR